MSLYLDHAASSPVRPEVWEAATPWLTRRFGNPSSTHLYGTQAADALREARARVAASLGVRAGDIIFTSGGTESNNLALKGIVIAAQSRAGAPRHIVTTAIEHESVRAASEYLTRIHGSTLTWAKLDATGRLTPDALAAALRPETALVAVGYANNEVGTVQDIAGLVAVASERKVPVHVDAVQAAGWLPLAGIGASSLAISGHKIGALPGTGILAISGRIPLEPLLHGGGQERDRRSGTENVAGAMGLAVALELAESERADKTARVGAWMRDFTATVLAEAPGARVTGHPEQRLPGVASFTFGAISGEAVLIELERRGVISSSGSACAAGRTESSPVLRALGIDEETAQSSVRFSADASLPADPEHAMRAGLAVAAAVRAVRSGE